MIDAFRLTLQKSSNAEDNSESPSASMGGRVIVTHQSPVPALPDPFLHNSGRPSSPQLLYRATMLIVTILSVVSLVMANCSPELQVVVLISIPSSVHLRKAMNLFKFMMDVDGVSSADKL